MRWYFTVDDEEELDITDWEFERGRYAITDNRPVARTVDHNVVQKCAKPNRQQPLGNFHR